MSTFALYPATRASGVLVDPDRGLMVTSDRGCGRVSVYRCCDESLVGRIEVGPHPNGLAYDPNRRNIFVFNLGEPIGSRCTVSVVSVDEMRVRATIPLPGRPRWAVYDPHSDMVFANIREPAEIIVIEAERLVGIAVFEVPAAGPHGLALADDRLFCAADAGKLFGLDSGDGHVLDEADLPGEPDVIMRDAERGRLFIAVGDPGVVALVDEGTFKITETIVTEKGAHTIAWDPPTQTVWAFLPARGGALALAEG